MSIAAGHKGATIRMKRCGEKRHMQTAKKRDVPKCKLGIAAMVNWKRLLFQTLEPPALLCKTSMKPYSGGSKRGGEQRQRVTMTKAIALSTAMVRRIRWNVEVDLGEDGHEPLLFRHHVCLKALLDVETEEGFKTEDLKSMVSCAVEYVFVASNCSG